MTAQSPALISAQSPARYDAVAQTLHWLMALAIIVLWIMGHVFEALPRGPLKSDVMFWHKSIGVAVLVLAVVRLIRRHLRPMPAFPATMTAWEMKLARLAHGALYGFMLIMPINGVLVSQSGGRAVSVFGLFDLPTLVGKSEPLHKAMENMHGALGWLLAVVLIAHAAAALRHHFGLKDDVLTRMLPRWAVRSS